MGKDTISIHYTSCNPKYNAMKKRREERKQQSEHEHMIKRWKQLNHINY